MPNLISFFECDKTQKLFVFSSLKDQLLKTQRQNNLGGIIFKNIPLFVKIILLLMTLKRRRSRDISKKILYFQ